MTTNQTNTMVPAESLDVYLNGVTEIAKAYLQNNRMDPDQLPAFLRSIGAELARAFTAATEPVDLRSIELLAGTARPTLAAPNPKETAVAGGDHTEAPEGTAEVDRFAHLSRVPAVPIKESVTEEAIICLFDGQPKQMLKRYIRAHFGMEADEYRRFWNLPDDYPLVAPAYAREKKMVAVAQGLGTSKVTKVPKADRVVEEKVAA